MAARISFSRVFLIIRKDLKEFSRDTVWMILSPVSLLMFAGLLLLLPDNPAELVSIGVYPASIAEYAGDNTDIKITGFNTLEALSEAVMEEQDYIFGVGFSDSSTELFLSSSVTPLQRRAAESAVREFCYATNTIQSGGNPMNSLPVRITDFQQLLPEAVRLSLKDKLKPVMFVVILLIESLALAGLISVEIENRTVSALLVTSTTTSDFLAAKILTGILLAFFQAFVFLGITGSFPSGFLSLFVITFLGAWMASSVGMISGAAGKDFMGTLLLGVLFFVPLLIPALAMLFKDTSGGLLRLIPSYGLTMSAVELLGGNSGSVNIRQYLPELVLWNCILSFTGLYVLKSKVESL